MKTHNRSFPEGDLTSDKVIQTQLGQTSDKVVQTKSGQTNPEQEITDKVYLKLLVERQMEILELLKKIAQKF